MPLVNFAAGQRIAAADLNTAFDWTRYKYQTADETVNNTVTLASSSYLVAAVEANSGYIWRSEIIYTAATAADFKFNLDMPTGASARYVKWSAPTAVAAAATTLEIDGADMAGTSFTISAGALGVGTLMSMRAQCVLGTSGTAGNITVKFAQVTANASVCTLRAQSWFQITKVL